MGFPAFNAERFYLFLSFGGNSGLPKCPGWMAPEAAVICSDHLGSSSQSSPGQGGELQSSSKPQLHQPRKLRFFGDMVMERYPDGDARAPIGPGNTTRLPAEHLPRVSKV